LISDFGLTSTSSVERGFWIEGVVKSDDGGVMDFLERYELVEVREVGEIARVPGIRSERAEVVARWFGIEKIVSQPICETASGGDDRLIREAASGGRRGWEIVEPKVGEIVLVMGASGAGKSSLLRGMRAERQDVTWVDLNEIGLPEVPIVDCFGAMQLEEVLGILSRVGLGEAWSYLRFPSELSEGQRWRLRLAVGMSVGGTAKPQAEGEGGRFAKPQAGKKHRCGVRVRGGGVILVADEFGAVLDRVTAGIVGRCLRRVVDSSGSLGAVVATSHEDLVGALGADVIVRCDFRKVEVWRESRKKN
jgi:uncharacterized protein